MRCRLRLLAMTNLVLQFLRCHCEASKKPWQSQGSTDKNSSYQRLPRRSLRITPRNDKPGSLHRTHASPTIGEVVRVCEPEGCQTIETDCSHETLTPLSFTPLSSSSIVGEPGRLLSTPCHCEEAFSRKLTRQSQSSAYVIDPSAYIAAVRTAGKTCSLLCLKTLRIFS